MKRLSILTLYISGILLLAINVSGFALKDRNAGQNIYTVMSQNITDRGEYLTKLTEAIAKDILHLDSRISFYDNYIMWVLGVREFASYNKAISRGLGLCSQHAIIESEILKEQDIPNRIVRLTGHVVLTAEVSPGEWWVLEPDFGFVIPHSMEEIESNPNIITKYFYSSFGDVILEGNSASRLAGIYEKAGNYICNGSGVFYYRPDLLILEKVSFILIWGIPILMIILAIKLL